MNELEKSRLKINEIDKKMIKLFKERMEEVSKVVNFKVHNGLQVLDLKREKEIISRNLTELNNPIYSPYYLDFFNGVLKSSKDYQAFVLNKTYRFALLGKSISYSYSPLFHNLFYKKNNINANYTILQISETELEYTLSLLKLGKYHGYNVTIPYKKTVMKYLDIIDEKAKKIGAVNTVVCRNNKLIGYNTDYYGFLELINRNNVDILNKNVYILGTGGAAKSIETVILDLRGKPTFVSRTISSVDTITYKDFYDKKDIDVIINTTPCGTYPNVLDTPLKKEFDFSNKVVIDIIYNPKQTALLKNSGSQINGLYMLYAQAVKADTIFLDKDFCYDESLFLELERVVNNE